MKAKLILFNKTFNLLLETNEAIVPMAKENQAKFLKRMHDTYGSVDPLEIVEIDEVKLEQATSEQLQKLAAKYSGTLYGQMIAHVLTKRGVEVIVEAPKSEVAKAKEAAKEANAAREAARIEKAKASKLKAEASKIEKETKAELAKQAREERLAKRQEVIDAKKELSVQAKAEIAAQRDAKKAELTLANETAKAEKLRLKEEAKAIAIAKKAAQDADKVKAKEAAKIAKDAAKIAKENEKVAQKEARDLAKAQKLADKAQKAAERANRVPAGLSAESPKYSQEALIAAREKVGKAIRVLDKSKKVKYEGVVNTIQLDKRNGIMMFKIKLADGKMVHSTIDSWLNEF